MDHRQEMERIAVALKPLFDAINSRLDGIESKMGGIGNRMDGIESKMGGIGNRMDGIESKMGGMEAGMTARFDRMAVQVSNLVGDVAEIKGTMATRDQLSALSSSLHKRIDGFLPVVETARSQQANADKSFWAHQERIDDHERRISRIEKNPD